MQIAGSSTPPLPEIQYGNWLIDALWSIGPMTPDGAPVGWPDIRAWAEQTRRTLSVWESDTLRAMSRSYAGQYSAARDPACPAPHHTIRLDSRTLSRHIRNMFAPVAKGGKGNKTGKKTGNNKKGKR